MAGTCPPDPRQDPPGAYLDLFNAVDEALARGDFTGARAALELRRELAEQLELELAATEPPS